MAKKIKYRQAFVISDTHFGCRLGLCSPDGVDLDDGGHYSPSKFQLGIWKWWREMWDVSVPELTRGEPFAVILNGDSIDGVHHGSTTQISQNIEDQVKLAIDVLSPIVEMCDGNFFVVRGTEAHVGKSGVHEERLARALKAKKNDVGQSARHELWINIGDALVHCQHHIGTTSSAAYESTAVHKEMTESLQEAARWNERPADIIVRSHRHRNIEVRAKGARGWFSSVVTPGWQGKTPFAYKIAGARNSLPQFGGVLVRQGDEEWFTRSWVRELKRPSVEG